MKQKSPIIKVSRAVEQLHHLRLMALLRELVRDRGKRETARVLGIDFRTLAGSLKAGRLSKRTSEALERALQYGEGSAAVEQRERNERLEDRLDSLETNLRASLRELETAFDEFMKGTVRQFRQVDGQLAGLSLGREDQHKNTSAGAEKDGQPPSSGPSWLYQQSFKELVRGDMPDPILEWRKALVTLMAAEDRLRMALERDAEYQAHGANIAEAPTALRAPRSAMRSGREIAQPQRAGNDKPEED